MNALQKVSSTAAQIERELSPADYDELANLYRLVRVELNTLYELLPTMEKQKYDNYLVQVTEYEKKIAEGVYNPDIDGVLKFDYDKWICMAGKRLLTLSQTWYSILQFIWITITRGRNEFD